MSGIPKVVWQLLAVVAVMLGLFWFKGCYDKRIIEDAKKTAAVDSGTVHIATARDTLRIKDSTVVTEKIRWVDVSRGAIASRPGDTTVANLVRSCNQFIVSCEDARKAAQSVIDSQDVQIKRLAKMKAMQLPRFSAFAEAGRSFKDKDWLGRGGVDFRLVGPISLNLAGELRAKDSKGDVIAALRYTFR